jgi:myo-inositol 2-dehydrogenase/D-chiro-inositol 1-dehydrogenase
MPGKVKVGLIGAGFVGDIHAHSIRQFVPEAEVVAVASATPGRAETFARERGIARGLADYRELLAMDEVELVLVATPNDRHAEITIAAAQAGKHVVCEKPLCRNLAEADRMIAACREANVQLLYAEELLFAPKYVRAKTLVDEGALGDVFLVKQMEEHPGPHEGWFWDVERSGGGVLLDMGCHSIEFTRWVLGRPRVTGVTAVMGTFVHKGRTRGEDHSVVIVEYEGGRMTVAENSWAKGGGDSTRGWTFTMFEEAWNYGFPQEMQHFARCVRGEEQPIVTGEDGREVLKILCAAYQSAGEKRKIEWPYEPPRTGKPIDLWLGR